MVLKTINHVEGKEPGIQSRLRIKWDLRTGDVYFPSIGFGMYHPKKNVI